MAVDAMNKRQSAASSPAPPAAGTHQMVADPLALMAARAVTSLVLGALVVAGAVLASVETDALWPLGALVLAVFPVVYGAVLLYNLPAERKRFYATEVQRNEDLNNDSFIGDPFNRVPVKREGATVAEVIVPHPSGAARGEPVMAGWGVSKSDLVAFVFEAERSRGLKEVAWVGEGVQRFILPSGSAVTQALFRQVLAALAEHQLDGQPMAAKEAQRWILKAKAEAIALEMNLK
jgi:hypothetical protein